MNNLIQHYDAFDTEPYMTRAGSKVAVKNWLKFQFGDEWLRVLQTMFKVSSISIQILYSNLILFSFYRFSHRKTEKKYTSLLRRFRFRQNLHPASTSPHVFGGWLLCTRRCVSLSRYVVINICTDKSSHMNTCFKILFILFIQDSTMLAFFTWMKRTYKY